MSLNNYSALISNIKMPQWLTCWINSVESFIFYAKLMSLGSEHIQQPLHWKIGKDLLYMHLLEDVWLYGVSPEIEYFNVDPNNNKEDIIVKVSITLCSTLTKIGLHACYNNLYLHEFFELVLLLIPMYYSPWSERDIWPKLKVNIKKKKFWKRSGHTHQNWFTSISHQPLLE